VSKLCSNNKSTFNLCVAAKVHLWLGCFILKVIGLLNLARFGFLLTLLPVIFRVENTGMPAKFVDENLLFFLILAEPAHSDENLEKGSDHLVAKYPQNELVVGRGELLHCFVARG
jgi:hypothetical protein